MKALRWIWSSLPRPLSILTSNSYRSNQFRDCAGSSRRVLTPRLFAHLTALFLAGSCLSVMAGAAPQRPASDPSPERAIRDQTQQFDFLQGVARGTVIDFQEAPKYLAPETRVSPTAPGACYECGQQKVTYNSWWKDRKEYQGIRYAGRFTAVLVPDEWPGSNGFTDDEMRILLDRLDIVYEHAVELLGREPGGSGLLEVAFVADTCGWGCGWLGSKRFEILNSDWSVKVIRESLGRDQLHGIFPHEMMHNFDLFYSYLSYGPMDAHAWTDFIQGYLIYYSQMGNSGGGTRENRDLPPNKFIEEWQRRTWEPYLFKGRLTTYPVSVNDQATWATCIRNNWSLDACQHLGMVHPNPSWGGLSNSIGLLHGPEVVKRSFGFLRDFEASNSAPSSAEDKEDLHIESLAAGARINLSCYVDAWRWHASVPLRTRMLDRYGQNAPLCEDRDGDQFSPIYGDCDDANPSRYPGAKERRNKIDDNCNGTIDERLYKEPQDATFPRPKFVTLPAQIVARNTDRNEDAFVANIAQAGPISIEMCADLDLEGGVEVFQDGSRLGYIGPGNECSRKTYELDRAGRLEMRVVGIGSYAMIVELLDPWPIPWGRLEPPRLRLQGTVDLTAVTESLHYASATPDRIRFWVSGYGFVGSMPYAEAATLKWRPKPALQHGSYGVRAQLMQGDNPVSDVTPATAWLAAAEPKPVIIEAESMALNGYVVESNRHASGKKLISRRRAPGKAPGRAKIRFSGPAGNYDVMVSYFDESDGQARLNFSLKGRTLDRWVADEDPDCQVCRRPNANSKRTRLIARGLSLAPGDLLGLKGTENRGDYARIDKITLSPVRAGAIEAETMSLTGFLVEDNTHASGGQLISRRRAPGSPPGMARTLFSGPSGSYEVTVSYFDEKDGQGKLAFALNGQQIDQWLADEDPKCPTCGRPNANTLRTRIVAKNLSLMPGDELSLEGSENRGDYARIDKIGFGPVQVSTLEAESLSLEGFLVENNSHASGGQLISRRRAPGKPPGKASTRFTGPAGIYDIAVSYLDENDGQARLAFSISGQRIDEWVADEDPDCRACGRPNAKTLRVRLVARGVSLNPGDKLRLIGTNHRGDFARFDKITLMRWGAP